jgi:beta-glucosidase
MIALIKAGIEGSAQHRGGVNNGAPVAVSEWIDDGGRLDGRLHDGPGRRLWPFQTCCLARSTRAVSWPKLSRSSWPIRRRTSLAGRAGKVQYGEGLFIGYRYYDAKQMPVQFPFGFGLS